MSDDPPAVADDGENEQPPVSSPIDATTVFVSPRLRCRHWVASDRADLLEVYGDADAMR